MPDLPLTDTQLAEIEAWTNSPLGPGPEAEQKLFAALVAEVRRLRAELDDRTEALASADDPTRLRWGLNDVMYGDDDTTTILLSGPDGEPYWLELDPERAAVLREDLAGPNGEEPATTTKPAPDGEPYAGDERPCLACNHSMDSHIRVDGEIVCVFEDCSDPTPSGVRQDAPPVEPCPPGCVACATDESHDPAPPAGVRQDGVQPQEERRG